MIRLGMPSIGPQEQAVTADPALGESRGTNTELPPPPAPESVAPPEAAGDTAETAQAAGGRKGNKSK